MIDLPLECRLQRSDLRPVVGALDYSERVASHVNEMYVLEKTPIISATADRQLLLIGYNALLASPIIIPVVYLTLRYLSH